MLSISVDLEPRGRKLAVSDESLTWTTRRLVELLNRAAQPATWFASDPATHDAMRWAREAGVDHEAGLVIAADCGERGDGRSRFVTDVLQGKAAAARAGWTISTLAMTSPPTRDQFEFLVKQGIAAIHSGATPGFNSLRYGLWQVGPDVRLGGGGRFSQWLNLRRICKAIDRAAAADRPLHLSIDLPAMAASPSNRSLGGMERLLSHLDERRAAGNLQVGTVSKSVAKLMQPRGMRAARSILRAA